MKPTQTREIPKYIQKFIKAVYPEYTELCMDSFNEKEIIITATQIIYDLRKEHKLLLEWAAQAAEETGTMDAENVMYVRGYNRAKDEIRQKLGKEQNAR